MNMSEWAYRLADLLAQDLDYVVDVLGLTVEDIIDKFPDEVDDYIEREFGDE